VKYIGKVKYIHKVKYTHKVKYIRPTALLLASLAFAAPVGLAHAAALDTVTNSPGVAAKSYILSPDDVIEVSVLGHEELRATVTILPDGGFDYPILGNVHAAGMTVSGLTQTLRKGLSKRYNQPEVTVYLRQGRLRRVSVLGDGSKAAGQFEFRTGMHLLDLLTAAGGLAGPPPLVEAILVTGGGQETTKIDLVPLMNGTDLSQNVPLVPGDTLFLIARNVEVGQVQVVGEVGKPGAYPITPSGISMLSLLNQAGGALPDAKLTKAQYKHDGMVRVIDLAPLLHSDLNSEAGHIRIFPGDELLIPANKNIVLALGEVRSAGVLSIPDDQPLTLTHAYALVGGATPDGDKKNVSIVRRTPSGAASLLSINMEDVLKGKNGVTDITLQPDDILFIQTRNRPKSVGEILGSLGSLGYLAQSARYLTGH
jgi:polysaccharide export outer membrane protein